MLHTARLGLALAAGLAAAVLGGAPALAHGFSSNVYADLTEGDGGVLHSRLELEYDLLVVSVADYERNDPLFQEGTAAFEALDDAGEAAALESHADSVVAYVRKRFTISGCTPARTAPFAIGQREGVPYATLELDWTCTGGAGTHTVGSELFADDEGYVKDAKTIVTYAMDGTEGSAALGRDNPSFSTHRSGFARFVEFFLLGAEHLLFGIDHILFLLALIVGARRLRDIVLAATCFTAAHSVTFLLAALGAVDVPARVVEPVIAASIVVVAAWQLIAMRRPRVARSRAKLAVVFLFGLVHGLGFAGALGIDEPWSWTLLWSLLVFNVGIESVQLAIIAAVFPLLALLRRRAPRAAARVTGAISAGVAVMGAVWLVQRLLAG